MNVVVIHIMFIGKEMSSVHSSLQNHHRFPTIRYKEGSCFFSLVRFNVHFGFERVEPGRRLGPYLDAPGS